MSSSYHVEWKTFTEVSFTITYTLERTFFGNVDFEGCEFLLFGEIKKKMQFSLTCLKDNLVWNITV